MEPSGSIVIEGQRFLCINCSRPPLRGKSSFLLHITIDSSSSTVDPENFGVKKVRIAHTSTKLKHTRLFYYENYFTFE